MPSLEQIVRPFVVDPTTPPVPIVTTSNEPPPEPVRLNIGIGRTRLSNLSSDVAPIIPPPTDESDLSAGNISGRGTSSSYSISIQFYQTNTVTEEEEGD